MCGLTGFVEWQGLSPGAETSLHKMTDAIANRGPDDAGHWLSPEHGIALGHRRLSIVDLSPAGHQPMLSASGRFVIVFNGEIYNHEEIRKELSDRNAAPTWQGHSDTETLLAGFETFGIEETVRRARGMFAFAVWDQKERTLTLARDRLGEKPVYYGWQGKSFLFGSELKALRAHPSFCAPIDRDALCLLLRHNCIGGPSSIYAGIHKLEPGCLLILSHGSKEPTLKRYWSGADVAQTERANSFPGTPDDAVEQLSALLEDAIKSQMMSDVPLGAFLSGGVDSSTIVALMQKQSPRPIQTFTIGFHEEQYNEAPFAKAVAQHLGTNHTELYVSPEQARDVIPSLPRFFDEPFSDSSQIPTFLVAQLAKTKVTVALSGDAGDELFCGYRRYQMTNALWRRLQLIPTPLRSALASLITAIPPNTWSRLVPSGAKGASFGDKLHKGADALTCRSSDELHRALASHWQDPAACVKDGREPETLFTGLRPSLPGLNNVERMMALDMLTYLPDDILVKTDRAAMAVSLEGRTPFLDPRVVAFAWSLPLSYKLRDGKTKWPLRQVLYRHVPQELIERPKTGFGLPLDTWLRGPLKNWAEDLLSEERLKREDFFNPAPIRQKWQEHLSGRRNWAYALWDVLSFQAWLAEHHR